MSEKENPMTLTFRCPKELDGLLPLPMPAAAGLPGWFKAMPGLAFNAVLSTEFETVKRCPPFIDAMTCGFLIPLICDVKVENGEFTWDNNPPPGGAVSFPRSPIGFHDAGQVTGTPLFKADQFLIKFHNLWTIDAPDGYSLPFTHPVNRFDLPFTTLTGLVACDRYHDAWIHFSAHWHDVNFSGVLPKGGGASIFAIHSHNFGQSDQCFMPPRLRGAHLRKQSARLDAIITLKMKISKPYSHINSMRHERKSAFEHRDTLVKASNFTELAC